MVDIKHRIKTMLQEAEIYGSQGLVAEAHEKYQSVTNLINSIDNLKNKSSLLKAVAEKIKALDHSKYEEPASTNTPELSTKAQDLIKNLFAFSDNKDSDAAALEGAVALAKFGQFDRALKELNALLEKESLRVEAAKNILRCHFASSSADEAVNQYNEWFASDLFQPNQLEAVRSYLVEILDKKGMDVFVPSPSAIEEAQDESISVDDTLADEPTEEEFLDITSIGITFDVGPSKGKMVEFDVNFQSGNMLSLIIDKKDQSLISELTEGMKLKDVQFFSPIAIFNGTGTITSKTQIKSGPKQGDFCLDIKITST
jgi:hypothetical protein